MLKLAGRRLLLAVPMLLIISFVIFGLVALTPGDPAMRLAGDNPTTQQVEQIRRALKLDQPLWRRYGDWVWSASRGDFGQSFSTEEPVLSLINDKIGITASLTTVALIFSLVIGISLGIVSALWPGGMVDRFVVIASSLGAAMPSFWLGILLVIAFALNHPWFPALGYVPLSEGWGPWAMHIVLPAIALSATPAAETALQLRSALADTLGFDYVLAARAKGASHLRVVLKHALKNAAIPVVTVLGVRVSLLLGGAVAVEQVFGFNGLGTVAVSSTLAGDLPVLLGLTMLATTIVILSNLLVDISYGYFNPKVRT